MLRDTRLECSSDDKRDRESNWGWTAPNKALQQTAAVKWSVNGRIVFWLVTNRWPGRRSLGYGAAHNLSVRTNNALARTVISEKPRRN